MNKRERFKKALQQPWAAMTFAACSAVVLFLLLSNLRVIGRGIGGLIGFVKPVLIGLIIAYVTDPLVVFFEQKVFRRVRQDTVRRGLGVLLTFFSIVLFIVLILVALIPQLISSVRLFISNLDSYSSAFSGLMQQLNDWASSHNVDISQYTSVGTNAVQLITSRLPKSVDGLLNTTITYGKNVFDGVIAVIIAIYFLMDKVRIRKGAHRLWKAIVSDSGYQKSNHFLGRCNEIMIRFILCDLLDGFIIGIANAAFMLVVGYPIGAGILVLINPWYALVFLIFTIALQTVDGYVIKPKLFGNTLGVPSIGILISIIVFGRMFGAVGVLLSIPFAAIIDYIYKAGILPKLEARKTKRDQKKRERSGMTARERQESQSERPGRE